MSPLQKWELLKIKKREFTQKYCKNKVADKKIENPFWEMKLIVLQNRIDNQSGNNDNENE